MKKRCEKGELKMEEVDLVIFEFVYGVCLIFVKKLVFFLNLVLMFIWYL